MERCSGEPTFFSLQSRICSLSLFSQRRHDWGSSGSVNPIDPSSVALVNDEGILATVRGRLKEQLRTQRNDPKTATVIYCARCDLKAQGNGKFMRDHLKDVYVLHHTRCVRGPTFSHQSLGTESLLLRTPTSSFIQTIPDGQGDRSFTISGLGVKTHFSKSRSDAFTH